MSLISHPENDSRQLYTSVGTYKGNLVAIRKVNKKNVELTRNIKKELKVVGRWMICHQYCIGIAKRWFLSPKFCKT